MNMTSLHPTSKDTLPERARRAVRYLVADILAGLAFLAVLVALAMAR